MSSQSYADGMKYEIFIRRAHNCGRGIENGAELSFVRNLINSEYKENHSKHLPQFNELIDDVKEYIVIAIDKFLDRNPTDEEQINLNELRDETESAMRSSEIVSIVVRGLEITHRYINL